MMNKYLAVKRIYLFLGAFLLVCSVAVSAVASGYQPTVSAVKNTDRARSVSTDVNAEQGFSYRFSRKVKYSEQYNVYTVGQHCYRGDPVRFYVPAERFEISIGNQEYEVFGRSVWDRFYTDSRWNFILSKLQLGYWVVALESDACADVVISTRYKTAELLQQTPDSEVMVKVFNDADEKIGTFWLQLR